MQSPPRSAPVTAVRSARRACARLPAQIAVTLLHLVALAQLGPTARPERERRRDRGQATTEYALVLLGAAMVALLLVAWATSGGGAGRIGRLLDRVLDAVSSKI
jgi:hypothetical protein